MSPGTDRPWNSAFQPDRGLGAFHSLRKAILAQRTQLGLDALKQCDEVLRTAQEPGLPRAAAQSPGGGRRIYARLR